MTLNGEMAFILSYFTEFGIVSGAHCIKVVVKAISMMKQFTITMSSSKRLQRDRATSPVLIFYNCKVEIL